MSLAADLGYLPIADIHDVLHPASAKNGAILVLREMIRLRILLWLENRWKLFDTADPGAGTHDRLHIRLRKGKALD